MAQSATMVGENLLGASAVARLCGVDLKTIHNWVDRGRIAHFRTPGRHLRFRPAEVSAFLRTWGYRVPRELARMASRSVLVVGSKDALRAVAAAQGAASAEVPVRHKEHPCDALVSAGDEPADVYVVDVKAVAPHIATRALLEALHRASPEATIVALGGDAACLPPFVKNVAPADLPALKEQLDACSP